MHSAVRKRAAGAGILLIIGLSQVAAAATAPYNRCSGAPDKEFVENVGCTAGFSCVQSSDCGWGKWCLPSNGSGSCAGGGGDGGGKAGDAGDAGDTGSVPAGWSTLETSGKPKPRHEATFVMADNGKSYLLGGRGSRPVSVYDVAANSWSDASSPPVEIHHFQAVYKDGFIWIPAAWTGPYPYVDLATLCSRPAIACRPPPRRRRADQR
jgi:hypothetical protein